MLPVDLAANAESLGARVIRAATIDGLRDALVQPAEMAGYQFETPALVDNMLEHLEATQGALPLLQFAATQLWESRDKKQQLLTVSAYKSMGGIVGALASHADSVLAGMSVPERALVRALCLRLVTPERTREFIAAEIEKWLPIVRATGATVD